MRKLKKKRLKKHYRWETITLDGFFWNKRRIEKDSSELYNLHIYWFYGNERQYFSNMQELRGILKGIFLSNFLTDKFTKKWD